MQQPNCFFVVSRFNEDVSWIKEYYPENEGYLIINKGEALSDIKCINKPNFGGNQYDICEYIYENYENLPDLIAFMQAKPFDHCKREKFDKIIYNNRSTSIEDYEDYVIANPGAVRKISEGVDSGYMEINDSWYIPAMNNQIRGNGFEANCPFGSFNDYMNSIFENYSTLDYLRFAPGSQYLAPKANCLFYSKEFWKHMMELFPKTIGLNGGTEGHIIERSMWYILNNVYKAKF